MQLHKPTRANKLAKLAAQPLSGLICSSAFYQPTRVLNAYLNFLIGQGSGTGWSLRTEIETALKQIHSPRPVIFDVGANIGEWSHQFLQLRPDAQIFLFEPSASCRSEIQRQRLANTILIPCAVGAEPGTARLHFSSATDGSASLHQRGESYFQDRTYQTVVVEVVTIDQIIELHQLEFVDFIKLDIEGHEYYALQGAQQALAAKRIGALAFEFGSGNINSRTFFRDFWTLLTTAGYRLGRITPSGRWLPISDYYEDLEYFRGVSNYLATLSHHPAA